MYIACVGGIERNSCIYIIVQSICGSSNGKLLEELGLSADGPNLPKDWNRYNMPERCFHGLIVARYMGTERAVILVICDIMSGSLYCSLSDF